MTETARLSERGSCSLDDRKVQGVLAHLHRESRSLSEGVRVAREFGYYFLDKVLRRHISVQEEAARLKTTYISLSAKQGKFAYLVARGLRARRIVEFGTSFGISTIYLAAALRDNGGGTVIGTEIEPTKVVAARANLAAAGVGGEPGSSWGERRAKPGKTRGATGKGPPRWLQGTKSAES